MVKKSLQIVFETLWFLIPNPIIKYPMKKVFAGVLAAATLMSGVAFAGTTTKKPATQGTTASAPAPAATHNAPNQQKKK